MAVAEWITSLIGGGASKIIDSVTDGVDKFVTTDEEKQQLALLKAQAELDAQKLTMQAEAKYFEDRQSAREMYMKDSSLQKTFAIVFLIGYCILSMGMIAMIIAMAFFEKSVNLPDWGVMLLSSVFTAMSTKVGTITDFLFGGSKSKDDSDKLTAQAFAQGQTTSSSKPE